MNSETSRHNTYSNHAVWVSEKKSWPQDFSLKAKANAKTWGDKAKTFTGVLEAKARPRGQRYCIMHGYVSSNTSSAEQEVTIRVTDNTVLTTEKRCLKYPESAFTHASLSNGSCVIQLAHSNIHSESKNCATIHSFTTSTNVGRFCYKTRTIDPRAAAVSRRRVHKP